MNPFFITGPQRSGTTLLSVVLSRHPDIDIAGKSVAFRLISCFGYYKDVLPYNLEHSKAKLLAWLIKNDYQGLLAEMFDFNSLDQYADVRGIIKGAIEQKLTSERKKVFGDKSPELEYFIAELLMLIPDSKFIHVVRDGRAAAHSKTNRTGRNIYLAAQEWVDGNILALSNQAMIGEKQYKIIRYEDLILEPEKTIRDICNFLGIEFMEDMLLEKEKKDEEKAYVKSTFDASKIDSYKEKVSAKQLKRIEKLQGPLLQRFNYQLEFPMSQKNHKQLYLFERLWLSQKDNFKKLFISKRMGMVNRENVEIKIPLKMRLKTYVFFFVYDLLSEPIFKRVFRKRWIKEVYMNE